MAASKPKKPVGPKAQLNAQDGKNSSDSPTTAVEAAAALLAITKISTSDPKEPGNIKASPRPDATSAPTKKNNLDPQAMLFIPGAIDICPKGSNPRPHSLPPRPPQKNTTEAEAETPDDGTPAPDPGATNAGATYAGATDAGTTDSGAPDSGATDAGATDARATDAGATDAVATDAGATNSGARNGETISPEATAATIPRGQHTSAVPLCVGSIYAILPRPGVPTASPGYGAGF
ncbi:hypothetical protein TWF718_005366 [Orbilia javanica]|uniref:Uncharacterized protein n=1 Tax=Orbilia javanica TaxID=47235 RepID=A0AAN8N083_9PEZI